MNAGDILEILSVDLKKYYDVIMINGAWGIGKTHYAKEAIKEEKFIYISLFGRSSIDQIRNEIMSNIFNSKFSNFGKKAYDLAQQSVTIGIPGVAINLPKTEKGKFSKEKILKKIKKEKQEDGRTLYIIFDDLERKNSDLKIESVLGLIEELSGTDDIKIVVITNENEMIKLLKPDDKDLYEKFKEKVIQKTYNIEEYSADAPTNIYDFNKLKSLEKQIERDTFLDIINNFLQKHNLKNLRTIQKTIPFLNEIFDNVDFENINEGDIQEILISSLAIVVEETEKIYLSQAINDEEKLKWMDGIYTSIDGRVLRYYFKTDAIMSNKRDLIIYLDNIFNDRNKKTNFYAISDYYKRLYSESTDGKNIDIFYRSQNEIKEYIKSFIKQSINRFDNSMTADIFLKKLDSILEYAKIFDMENQINDSNVLKRINEYLSFIDCNKSIWEIKHDLDFHFIRNERVKMYIKELNNILEYAYYKKIIEQLKTEVINCSLNYKILENLSRYFDSADTTNKNLYQFIRKELKKNNYFSLDINEDISEAAWTWNHELYKMMGKLNPVFANLSKEFSKFASKLIKDSTPLGKYRLDALIEQYRIKIKN